MLCILWETAMTIGLRLRIRKLLVRSSDGRVVLRALVVLSLSFLIESSSLRAQNPTSILEEIEWTWEVRPQRADPKFPNVLVGDSRNYFPQVTEDLRGVADVCLMASSTSVGDPRIDARTAIAQAFMDAEKMLVDDQHDLITQHPDLYQDSVHFNKVGSAVMGDHAATIIKRVLMTPGRERHGED
jgi:hypothetical protein